MAELRIIVCDQCGDLDRNVRRYSLITDARTVSVDLCAEHAQPLEDIVGLVPETAPSPDAIAEIFERAATAATVTPLDELAARKRGHKPTR